MAKMMGEYSIVGVCPTCGAPLLVHAESFGILKSQDTLHGTIYLPGIVYMCFCHTKELPERKDLTLVGKVI